MKTFNQYEYNHSQVGRASRQKYRISTKGRLAQKKAQEKTRKKYPEKIKAREAIHNEIHVYGRWPRAKNCPCTNCGNQASQYHHWRGYEKRFWLDVIPVCHPCHLFLESLG